MRFTRTKIVLLAVLALAGNFSARAQSNGVPGDADYDKFSGFITDRNIFDPNRYPHNQRTSTYHRPTRAKTHSNGPQGITLVGTMVYEKGCFAFFNAGDSDLKKVVATGGEIADYTVKEISATAVTLAGKDKKEFTMKIGDQMHREGGGWKLNEDTSDSAPASEPAAAASSSPSAEAPSAAPSPTLEGNDILKKLMEKRAKENQ